MSRKGIVLILVALLSTTLWVSDVNVVLTHRMDGLELIDSKVTPSYETHSTISIIGDDAFATKAEAEEWEGDGSYETPYIIEGYNITADITCINMYDLSVYFTIRDCYLTAGFDMGMMGITFNNVTNGRVEDCIIEFSFMGIDLFNSPGNVIDNCNVSYCDETGIQLFNSNDTTISHCFVYHSGDGFNIGSSYFVTVESCTVWESYGEGIHVSYCENIALEDNDVYANGEYGSGGVEFNHSHNNTLTNNNLFDNYKTGLYITTSSLFNISGSSFFNNSDRGIELTTSCNWIEIMNCEIGENGWWSVEDAIPSGIVCGGLINLTIHDNQIYNNSENGILMNDTYKPIIIQNEIYQNPQAGIVADNADYGHIEMNLILQNGWNHSKKFDNGIYTTFCNEWNISHNQIIENSHSGLILFDSWGHTIENNFVNWSVGYNIALIRTTNSTVKGNHLIGDLSRGIECQLAHHCNITDNIVQGSNAGIRAWHADNVRVTGNIVWGSYEYGIEMIHADDCWVFMNDVGWTGIGNALEDGCTGTLWDNDVDIGNYWHDYVIGSGDYPITNESAHIQNYDRFPNRSIRIISTSGSTSFEITSTGNTITMLAAALHPLMYEGYANGTLFDSGGWSDGTIVFNLDGLSAGYHAIELRAIHYSLNYESVFTSADVVDNTPPEWIVHPTDEELYMGELFTQQLEAYDPSGIGSWYTNDSANFHISEGGLLTNNSVLDIREYGLRVYVEDVFGNVQDWDIRITIDQPTTTISSSTTSSITTTTSSTTTTLTTSTTSSDTTTNPTSTTPTGDGDYTIIIIIGVSGILIVIIIIIISRKR